MRRGFKRQLIEEASLLVGLRVLGFRGLGQGSLCRNFGILAPKP